jgi:hypothetical protein
VERGELAGGAKHHQRGPAYRPVFHAVGHIAHVTTHAQARSSGIILDAGLKRASGDAKRKWGLMGRYTLLFLRLRALDILCRRARRAPSDSSFLAINAAVKHLENTSEYPENGGSLMFERLSRYPSIRREGPCPGLILADHPGNELVWGI